MIGAHLDRGALLFAQWQGALTAGRPAPGLCQGLPLPVTRQPHDIPRPLVHQPHPPFPHRSLYQLTWRSPRAWVYAAEDLGAPRLASTPLLDGWGITNDGTHLILGDSSPTLTWVDPGTMARLHQRSVHDAGRAVPFLNELEWVDGAILANIWGRECLVRVSPTDGRVLAWVDLRVGG